MTYCKECLSKQQKINDLEEEITTLKSKLRYQERTAKEGFFGSSTSSAKIPVKPNRQKEHQRYRGGGKIGHQGHGRTSISEEDGTKARAVIDCQPIEMKKIVYHLQRKHCPKCKKLISARPPGVFSKCLYSNQLLAYVAVQHYIYGNTLGQIEKQTGIGYSSLIDAMHQLSKRLKNVPNALIAAYRASEVKHADETGWRTDGNNGYAWLFCTPKISIFRVRKTRSASVPKEVFGEKPVPGVLVVDRYNGYNKLPVEIQYCYAHLLTVKDLEKDFPENTEIKSFVEALAPQLANAMTLRTLDITNKQFKRQATKIKNKIIDITDHQAKHPAIQKVQDIFREKANRLYHWADNRNIPADNNLAERELRPLVIARKISFGSQSDAGAKTREILMTVLHTLKKRSPDVTVAFKSALDKIAFKSALDKIAEQADTDPQKAIFSFNSS
jgi:transposase